jgi:hypothetical protein
MIAQQLAMHLSLYQVKNYIGRVHKKIKLDPHQRASSLEKAVDSKITDNERKSTQNWEIVASARSQKLIPD